MARRIDLFTLVLIAGLASSVTAQIRGDVVVSGLRTPVAAVADPTDRSVFFVV